MLPIEQCLHPVTQTVLDRLTGNCLSACIASVFGFDLEDVPNFCDETIVENREDRTYWFSWLRKWLNCFGVDTFMVDSGLDTWLGCLAEGTIVIAGGKSPRYDNGMHAIVMRVETDTDGNKQWKTVWDPHPSRDGIKGDVMDVMIFYPVVPLKMNLCTGKFREVLHEADMKTKPESRR